jgi:urea transport system permease protein
MLHQKQKALPTNRYIDMAAFLFLVIFPMLFTPFRTELMAKVLVYIIFAMSLDLLWGYTGLMSMGHAVLFGAGGYVIALSYTFIKGIPWYMQQVGMTEIPALFVPLLSPIVAFALALIIPALIAAFIGTFIFSSRISGTFFSLITHALAQMFELFVTNQHIYTNGSNGMGGLERSLLGSSPMSLNTLYYILFALVLLVYFFCIWLTKTRFGTVLQAIRENEPRLTFLGYKPHRFKIAVYVISGMLAGLAGMLYIPTNGFISPTEVGLTLSTLLLVWVAIGGRGNLTGAIVGTLLINWAQTLLSEQISDYWMLIMGLVMMVFVFFLPNGFIGKLVAVQYSRADAKRKIEANRKEAC